MRYFASMKNGGLVMAPSHSKPEQVSAVMKQIIVLLDSIDNKVLIAYYEWLGAQVRKKGYMGEYDIEYALLTPLFAWKVVQQNARRLAKQREVQ